MRILKANKIFDLAGEDNLKYIVIENDTIIDLSVKNPVHSPKFNIEKFEGFITPGFFNCHCHLELSHLKSRIQEADGLPKFIASIGGIRDVEEHDILQAIRQADQQMVDNGIVFVGDISNNSLTANTKKESSITYHTFVEAFGLDPERAESTYQRCKQVVEKFGNNQASITPHSPYSVSSKLFELIEESNQSETKFVSIHNQETESENQLYENKTGALYNGIKNFAPHIELLESSGKSSIQSYSKQLNPTADLLFVHNTFTSQEDIQAVKELFNSVYWCLCPNSNFYIERSLPDFELFSKHTDSVVLGTDSLASNHQLSILAEINTLLANSKIELEEALNWACKNPARYFKQQKLGSIEVGKLAKLNLISKDFKESKPI